jgi:hypothetical protein
MPPTGEVDLGDVPEDIARRLFEALRLELHYDRNANRLTCRVTPSGPTIEAVRRAANGAVTTPTKQPQRADLRDGYSTDADSAENGTPTVPMLMVPPTGFKPALGRFRYGSVRRLSFTAVPWRQLHD